MDDVPARATTGKAGREQDATAAAAPAGRRGALARLGDLLLGTEPRQRQRLGMSSFAALLMLCCIGAMYLGVAAGLAPAGPVHWWAAGCTLGLVIVYALIRSGWSQRWRDPSLTLAQVGSAMTFAATAFVLAGAARGIVMPVLAIILMFGTFGLSRGQMLAVLAYGLALFAAAIGVARWQSPELMPLPLAAAYVLMAALVLLSATVLNMRTQATREKLRAQKVELARAMEQVRELATRDELTGLPNRRSMMEALQLQAWRAQRGGRPALVAQLDLDHFKAVNDAHGHGAGDAALRAFARAVRGCVRAGDLLARWGGEEFVLLAADTAPAEGEPLLERVRQAVADMTLPMADGTTLRLTVSIGVAHWRPGEPIEGVLQRADAALYDAKRLGRNRVIWAPGDAPAP